MDVSFLDQRMIEVGILLSMAGDEGSLEPPG